MKENYKQIIIMARNCTINNKLYIILGNVFEF